jgi:hypothetical protein
MSNKLTYADIQTSPEHYFVIVGALDADGNPHYWIDDDTADAVFPDGTVWSPKFGEWSPVSDDTRTVDKGLWQELANRIQI